MNRKELIANVDKVYQTASRYSDRGRIIGERLGIDCNLNFKTDFSNRENYSFEWHWTGSQIGDAIIRTVCTVGALVKKPFDAASSDMLSKWSKKFADLYYYVDEITIEADSACHNDTPSEAL